MEARPVLQEHVPGRRAVAGTLALLGCAGLAVSMARAMTWDVAEPASSGSCVVSEIRVDYDVDYVPSIGGYGVTAAELTDVPTGCEGREIALTLHDADDAALAEARAAVTTPTTTLAFTTGVVAAEDVTGVSVALVTDQT
jgi:hypothetical protein